MSRIFGNGLCRYLLPVTKQVPFSYWILAGNVSSDLSTVFVYGCACCLSKYMHTMVSRKPYLRCEGESAKRIGRHKLNVVVNGASLGCYGGATENASTENVSRRDGIWKYGKPKYEVTRLENVSMDNSSTDMQG